MRIVDHAATDALRAKYRDEPNIDASRIEDVDFVWDGRPLSEAVAAGAPYDYIVASHVIEHMPDMLGFLLECEKSLAPGGTIFLAVPDKRRCFDVLRPLSTTAQVLQAYHERRNGHTPATAFEHVGLFAVLDGAAGWSKGARGTLDLAHSLAFAQAVFDRSVASDAYFDFHAWVFTPSSFRLILAELAEAQHLGLHEQRFELTDSLEFFMTLRRSGSGPALDRMQLLRDVHEELLEYPERRR